MKKWFVGLMVLLTLVLASSTAMAVADYRVCSNCWAYRNGTTEYITDPNEIETSWDMHTDRIFTCSVCSVKTKLWSLHTGGGATCTTEGECDFCHASYKDESAHTGPYTYSYSKTSDTRHNVKATCKGCWRKAGTYSAKHEEAEAATCKTVAYCGLCRSRYGEKDPDNHVGKAYAIDAKKISETQHTPKWWYECCGYMFDGDPTEHTIRDEATCKTAAYCGLCRSRYGEKDPGNHVGTPTTTHVKTSETQHTAKITYADCGHTVDGASTYHTETTPATCTAAAYCADCKSSYGEADPDAHALESHDAQAPTCTEVGWEAYQTCTREGCTYTTYQEIPAQGHDYAAKTTPATCTAEGYTTYTCTRCGDSYRGKKVPALQHWYAGWTPNGDATHAAPCKRDCDKIGSADCAAVAWAVLTGEVRTEFTLCPVCGEIRQAVAIGEERIPLNDAQLLLVEDAAADALTEHLPAGEIVVRMGELENGELLMSVAFEISGKMTQPTGQVKITLPAEALSGHTLAIIEEDGTEAPIELEIEEDTAAFTLDFTGSQTPVALLRLLPQA